MNKLKIEGDFYTDVLTRLMYATDASVYREIPLAVARPKSVDDIKSLIAYAKENKTSLIPRAAGTSLAGQCVGNGIVVDISKYFTEIPEINVKERWVRVQPGVILSELNKELEKYSLFFGPETSTANRCMIGGMVGNNSCGLHSLIYGSTREHTLEIKVVLGDGSEAVFNSLNKDEFEKKINERTLESRIYSQLKEILTNKEICEEIEKQYPLKSIPRRNTGYALDLLLNDFYKTSESSNTSEVSNINLCKLLCGSEGTLAFITEIKLNLVPLSKNPKALLCVHLDSVEDAMYANLIALRHKPNSVELVDRAILDLAKENIEQEKNRFFIQGDPGAILIIEIEAGNDDNIKSIASDIISEMSSSPDFRLPASNLRPPLVWGSDMRRVWNLRSAGLGVMANMQGDAKPQGVIEDTAISVDLLPEFYKDFQVIMNDLNLYSTYYAHIGTGEIHIRPVINLKTKEGVEAFKKVAERTAVLVKKYRGSLSGEHGDGRLRGEFIRLMLGENLYDVFREVKHTWDPDNIFNPGKIVDTPSMNSFLRFNPNDLQSTASYQPSTIMDFTDTGGLLSALEKCNGSADCRKTLSSGGIMCPGYMATKDEINSTRARANILREYFNYYHLKSQSPNHGLNENDVIKVLDLCLSCKGCKSECPSNIDMSAYKAEFMQHYYNNHSIPLRAKFFAYIAAINRLASVFAVAYNLIVSNSLTAGIIKQLAGIAKKRTFPRIRRITLTKWYNKNFDSLRRAKNEEQTTAILFVDEFLQYNDVELGKKAIKLLFMLGFDVKIYDFRESGRTFISKGLLRKAKKIADGNIRYYKGKVSEEIPLIGIEPSAILTFRDEYIKLADNNLKQDAINLSKNCFLIEEFLSNKIDFIKQRLAAGNNNSGIFKSSNLKILLHGHCHQKVLASIEPSKQLLSLIAGAEIEVIPSGCCGMAGSFGYEKEHYDVSMQIGEMVLFPAVRAADNKTVICAPGTSCRQQIYDGTGRKSYHPVEVLYDNMIN